MNLFLVNVFYELNNSKYLFFIPHQIIFCALTTNCLNLVTFEVIHYFMDLNLYI